jgi:hypothetical protein
LWSQAEVYNHKHTLSQFDPSTWVYWKGERETRIAIDVSKFIRQLSNVDNEDDDDDVVLYVMPRFPHLRNTLSRVHISLFYFTHTVLATYSLPSHKLSILQWRFVFTFHCLDSIPITAQ